FTEKRAIAERGRIPAEPAAQLTGDLEPLTAELSDLRRQPEVVRPDRLQRIRRACLMSEQGCATQFGVVRNRIAIPSLHGRYTEQCSYIHPKAVALGTVEVGRRGGIGPGTIEECNQAG